MTVTHGDDMLQVTFDINNVVINKYFRAHQLEMTSIKNPVLSLLKKISESYPVEELRVMAIELNHLFSYTGSHEGSGTMGLQPQLIVRVLHRILIFTIEVSISPA